MLASILRKLAALLCALVPLLPLIGLYVGMHDCACGMSRDACFCELTVARAGAHCGMGGGACSMRPLRDPSAVALLASFDLRGWLWTTDGEAARPLLAPAGAISRLVLRAPRSFSRSPESPPPRFVLSA